jgi:hypothetical protein
MQKLIMVVCALLFLGGCSRHYHPLMASKKASLVSELVSDAPRCSAFKSRLLSPLMDDDAIDEVYHDATKAKCINEDI